MNAEIKKRALLLSLCVVVSLPGVAIASLESPSLKLPANLEPAKSWRKDIVLEARSPYARLRLTKLDSLKTIADQFDLNGRDADRLQKQGAKVQKRLRAFMTAGGRRLLAIESLHRDKQLFTGYVNGPNNTYAFLASGLQLSQVVSAVETLQFPGETIESQLDPRIGPQAPLPIPEELRDAPAPLAKEELTAETVPEQPAAMFQKQKPSPWPDRFKSLFGWTMLLVGLGFIWRLISWAGARKSKVSFATTVTKAAPGSAAALTPLPPFKRSPVHVTPLPLPKRNKQTA